MDDNSEYFELIDKVNQKFTKIVTLKLDNSKRKGISLSPDYKNLNKNRTSLTDKQANYSPLNKSDINYKTNSNTNDISGCSRVSNLSNKNTIIKNKEKFLKILKDVHSNLKFEESTKNPFEVEKISSNMRISINDNKKIENTNKEKNSSSEIKDRNSTSNQNFIINSNIAPNLYTNPFSEEIKPANFIYNKKSIERSLHFNNTSKHFHLKNVFSRDNEKVKSENVSLNNKILTTDREREQPLTSRENENDFFKTNEEFNKIQIKTSNKNLREPPKETQESTQESTHENGKLYF